MSKELIDMLEAVFGDDPNAQVYGMDEQGVFPVNEAARRQMVAHEWELVDIDTEEQIGEQDVVLDPSGDMYLLLAGKPPAKPGTNELGLIKVSDQEGTEFWATPSIFNLQFLHIRSHKV